MPVDYDGHLLRFFHSTSDSGPKNRYRVYCMGAYLMEKRPPFRMIRMSKKPIIFGSPHGVVVDLDKKKCPHWKPNVVFPGGVVTRNGHWLVSIGVNDCECALIQVKPEDLNL